MSKNKNKAKKSRRRARPKTAAVAGVSVHGTQPATAPSVARSNDLRSRISFGPAEHEEASSSVGDNSEDGTDSGDDSRPAFENTKSEHAKPKDLKSRASFGPGKFRLRLSLNGLVILTVWQLLIPPRMSKPTR